MPRTIQTRRRLRQSDNGSVHFPPGLACGCASCASSRTTKKNTCPRCVLSRMAKSALSPADSISHRAKMRSRKQLDASCTGRSKGSCTSSCTASCTAFCAASCGASCTLSCTFSCTASCLQLVIRHRFQCSPTLLVCKLRSEPCSHYAASCAASASEIFSHSVTPKKITFACVYALLVIFCVFRAGAAG